MKWGTCVMQMLHFFIGKGLPYRNKITFSHFHTSREVLRQWDLSIFSTHPSARQMQMILRREAGLQKPRLSVANSSMVKTGGSCVKDAYVGSEDATDINLDPAVTTTYKENSFAVWASTLDRNDTMNGWYKYPLPAKTMKNN